MRCRTWSWPAVRDQPVGLRHPSIKCERDRSVLRRCVAAPARWPVLAPARLPRPRSTKVQMPSCGLRSGAYKGSWKCRQPPCGLVLSVGVPGRAGSVLRRRSRAGGIGVGVSAGQVGFGECDSGAFPRVLLDRNRPPSAGRRGSTAAASLDGQVPARRGTSPPGPCWSQAGRGPVNTSMGSRRSAGSIWDAAVAGRRGTGG